MPKNFRSENKKAVSAKERKAAAEEEKLLEMQKKLEDSYWKDDDKQLARKQQRKQQSELKKQNLIENKAKNKAILAEEMGTLESSSKLPIKKLTRAEISATKTAKTEKISDAQLEMNFNKIDEFVARNVVDAINMLSLKEAEVDKNPEKRRKAGYEIYEERRLKELKTEKPGLRLSQMKQIVFKEWQNSPENPINKI